MVIVNFVVNLVVLVWRKVNLTSIFNSARTG